MLEYGPTIVHESREQHTATVILLHGLTGSGEFEALYESEAGICIEADGGMEMHRAQLPLTTSLMSGTMLVTSPLHNPNLNYTQNPANHAAEDWGQRLPEVEVPHIKLIAPNAPLRPITLDLGEGSGKTYRGTLSSSVCECPCPGLQPCKALTAMFQMLDSIRKAPHTRARPSL